MGATFFKKILKNSKKGATFFGPGYIYTYGRGTYRFHTERRGATCRRKEPEQEGGCIVLITAEKLIKELVEGQS